MRRVSPDETAAWLELARAHGFVDAEGHVQLGRHVVEDLGDVWALRLVTPLPAEPVTDDLQPKAPPIRFDRTPLGQVIIPGRWWATLFERVSADPTVTPEVRQEALRLAREGRFADTLLPPDTDTVVLPLPDREGRPVPWEALLPGTRLVLPLLAEVEEDREADG